MKKLIFVTTAAFACCALTASAQVQILSGQPTLAPRLVSDQNPLAEIEPLPLGPADQERSANPFDYFGSGSTPAPDPLPIASDLMAEEQAPPSDPTSLPVAKNLRSMVDTIVDQGVLTGVANASSTPVYWGGASQTPNPVAQWLMREECVDGLWANYPQQRAAECAHMWSHIAGHSCCKGSCSANASCHVCTQPGRNRYTENCAPAANGVHSVPTSSCDEAGCTQCAQAIQQPKPASGARLPAAFLR